MLTVHETKHALMLHGLVRCPTIEQLFYQLNGVKMRLLGPKCELLSPPPGVLANAPIKDKGAKDKASKKAKGGADANVEVTWQLCASVVSVKGLRQGASAVSAKLKCVGQRYSTASVRRTSSGASAVGAVAMFDAQKEYLWNGVCKERDESVLEVIVKEDAMLGATELGAPRGHSSFLSTTPWRPLLLPLYHPVAATPPSPPPRADVPPHR